MAHASLILCATPRSGSTLLCDLLTATGVAGRPASFYRREDVGDWAERLGVPAGEGIAFERAYLEAVRQQGTGNTGMFALRLMWPSLPELLARLAQLLPGLPSDAARLERAFGAPLYLHLSRRDKVAQAVSRLKAEQTGLWHLAADGSERERTAPPQAPRYDGDRLAAFVAEAEAPGPPGSHNSRLSRSACITRTPRPIPRRPWPPSFWPSAAAPKPPGELRSGPPVWPTP